MAALSSCCRTVAFLLVLSLVDAFSRRHASSMTMIAPQQLGFFSSIEKQEKRVVCVHDLVADNNKTRGVDFHGGWNMQRQYLQAHLDVLKNENRRNEQSIMDTMEHDESKKTTREEAVLDTVLFLEHEPVYTLGTGSDESFIKNEAPTAPVPVVRMDRGGEVTYHGPGQLTVYPILDLRYYRQDIHWYVRALEEVVILALQECGLEEAHREPGVTGVWIQGYKVAAIGVKCKRWITQHGLAINVTPESLGNFDGIVPCGLEGRQVGCVQQFLEDPVTVKQMVSYVRSAMEEVFKIQWQEDIKNLLHV